MVTYGATIENLNLITEKSKGKKDGVYSFRGVDYRVKTGRFTHFAHKGQIQEMFGNFTVTVGKYEPYGAKAALKQI